MEVQNIMEVATKDVLTISEDELVTTAITKMYEHNHRDIVILTKNRKKYGMLSTVDLIKMKKEGFDFDCSISSIPIRHIETITKKATVLDALSMIKSFNCPICVVDEGNDLCGFVSYHDIVSSIDPSVMLERRMVGEFLIAAEPKKASQESSLCDILGMLDQRIYDCVILTDDENRSVGIITTKDVVKFFQHNTDMKQKAKEFMVQPLLTISYSTSIKEALSFITDKHFKRLIIADDNGNVIGQITQEDLLAKIYSRWASIMKSSHNELEEINRILNEKASEYELMSVTDSLTSIYNRGKFEVELHKEIHRVTRYKTDMFSLVFFDIDNFKRINDTYGHITGDKVLKIITGLLKESLRLTDVFARWGGEEFAIIMSHTSLEEASYVAEKLRKKIEQQHIEEVGTVTCSFGVSEFIHGDSIQSLMLRVDNYMYEAKKQGKNRVVTSI